MSTTSIIDRISEKIFGHPLAKRAEVELEAENLAQRNAWAAELSKLDTEELDHIRSVFEPEQAEALAVVRRHEAALADARERLFGIQRARSASANETSRRRDRILWALRDSASPLIAAFESELRGSLRQTFEQRHAVSEMGINGVMQLQWTNAASLKARIEATNVAIRECGESGELRYLPYDEAELTAVIDRMRATIPEIEQVPEKYRHVGHGLAS